MSNQTGGGSNSGGTTPGNRNLFNQNQDPDAIEASAKDEQITNIFYYLFFGILFLIAFVILINCIISLYQHKVQEREEELLRQDRARQAQRQNENSSEERKACTPGGYVPGLTFQPRSIARCKCKPPRVVILPTRRDYIDHLDTV